MVNKNALNDQELRQVNGGMIAYLEEVSGGEVKVKELEPDSWDEATHDPDDNTGKIVLG